MLPKVSDLGKELQDSVENEAGSVLISASNPKQKIEPDSWPTETLILKFVVFKLPNLLKFVAHNRKLLQIGNLSLLFAI